MGIDEESTDITERIRAKARAREESAEQGFDTTARTAKEREDEEKRRSYRESGMIQHRP